MRAKFGPDFTIHLGDVYFVGDEHEISENFLGENTSPYEPVKWPMGTKGSFALTGNHEMYARGNGYFGSVLPRMGLREAGSEWGSGQWASFFCLENKHWRIIGLDTGYNATNFDWGKLPVFENSKWIRKSLQPQAAMHDSRTLMLHGLRTAVNPDGDNRGLILLSHHGCYSSFSDWYQIPAQQLARIIHRPVIWFWGHEHKLAIYDQYAVRDGIERMAAASGTAACRSSAAPSPTLTSAAGSHGTTAAMRMAKKSDAGFNGHVNLSLDGPALRVEYHDLHCERCLPKTGAWTWRPGARRPASSEDFAGDDAIHLRSL